MPLIELDRLAKTYGGITALAGLDLRLDGRVIGLLGPNGAGKSTLLKCLLGLTRFGGEARVLGLSARTRGRAIRDRIGYMPEHDALLAGYNAVELCAYVGELSGLPLAEAMQRAHAALDHAGLEDKRYQVVDGYSTGMKQRVKLAQALVHDPELLFLDEPTSGLDPRSRDQMLELIARLPDRHGCSIVLSTHLLHDVERVCDTAVILDRGRVCFAGTLAALRGADGQASGIAVHVRSDATRLAEALTAAGAACTVTSPTTVVVELPPSANNELVFAKAREVAVQVRGLDVRRESIERAFLRAIGAA